jgi:Reverse transcriptase (RNA-dependent DNA polymerase)
VQGHHQIPGKDFMETFAPTLCKESLRFVITLKNLRHMASGQLDVDCVFLNGKIDRMIYFELPQEVYSDAERRDKIGLLKPSLYGLKQSPMLWNAHLDEAIQSSAFTKSQTDPCIYFSWREAQLSIIAIYVDNILICSDTKSILKEIVEKVKGLFSIKDLGEISYILGIKCVQN